MRDTTPKEQNPSSKRRWATHNPQYDVPSAETVDAIDQPEKAGYMEVTDVVDPGAAYTHMDNLSESEILEYFFTRFDRLPKKSNIGKPSKKKKKQDE